MVIRSPGPHPNSSTRPLQELGAQPYLLLWLRYTGFIVLYPLGVSSELTMVWLALPAIRAGRLLYLDLPNPLNFGFDYHLICWVVVALYAPGACERARGPLRACGLQMRAWCWKPGCTGTGLPLWACAWHARASTLHAHLPGAYMLPPVLALCSAGFPQLYSYMLSQRRKLLGGAGRAKKDKKIQ